MKPSKPFLFCLALVAACGATVLLNAPSAHAASANEDNGMPLSTTLTPAMVDFFGLQVAYDRPSIAGLVACHAEPACGQSDSSQVRIFDRTGAAVARWDGKPGSIIEQVRTLSETGATGAVVTRRMVRRFGTDEQGRVVMNGTDSIVRVVAASAGSERSRVTRVNRYSDVRYLLTDPRFVWPLTGLVVLELSSDTGARAAGAESPTVGHAAVSFDGTAMAHIITTGALSHTADLAAKRLETSVPDR